MSNLGQRGRDFLDRTVFAALQTETVTFEKIQPDDSFVATPAVPAIGQFELHGLQEVRPGVILPVKTKAWHVQSSAMPAGVEPERGDRIVTADPYTWVVEEAHFIAWKTEWRLKCWRQVQ